MTVLQWGRGCSTAEIPGERPDEWVQRVASMGPRLCSRGNSGCPWSDSASRCGFNGAAAVQPRKSLSALGRLVARSSLQWGRGCSAAEITVFTALDHGDAMLQWGRGCSAAEIRRRRSGYHAVYGFNGAAAVQPRKCEGGREGDGHGCASMGPRLFSRGNVRPARRHRRRHARLQWGRGLFSRGNGWRTSHRLPSIDAALQWGRGLFSRGNARAADGAHGVPAAGFNGAAAVQPRKRIGSADAVDAPMRRFNGAAAVQPRKAAMPSQLDATAAAAGFNGAAACSAAETSAATCDELAAASTSRFNGAAAVQPRKRRRCRTRDFSQYDASMGPRLFSRGNKA